MEAWVKRSIVILKKVTCQYGYRFYKMASFGLNGFITNLNITNFSAKTIAITAIFTARDYAQRALDIEPNDLFYFLHLDSL